MQKNLIKALGLVVGIFASSLSSVNTSYAKFEDERREIIALLDTAKTEVDKNKLRGKLVLVLGNEQKASTAYKILDELNSKLSKLEKKYKFGDFSTLGEDTVVIKSIIDALPENRETLVAVLGNTGYDRLVLRLRAVIKTNVHGEN